METLRNNARLAVSIPSYANLTVYGLGCYLTVTFPIREKIVPFLVFSDRNRWNAYEFAKNGKHYITATINIPFAEIAERHCGIEDVVYSYARKMCKDLKVRSREARIASLKAEIAVIASSYED